MFSVRRARTPGRFPADPSPRTGFSVFSPSRIRRIVETCARSSHEKLENLKKIGFSKRFFNGFRRARSKIQEPGRRHLMNVAMFSFVVLGAVCTVAMLALLAYRF